MTNHKEVPMSLNEPTHQKLLEMKLTEMAAMHESQRADPKVLALDFDDRFAIIVDAEHNARFDRRLSRRLKAAQLRIPSACLEDVRAGTARGLDKATLRQLLGGEWLTRNLNVLISGATGVGKTHLACALGQRACRLDHHVLYRRVPRLLEELALGKADGSYGRQLAKLARVKLLILDDLGMGKLKEPQRHDLLEVLEDRYDRSSTVLCSQLPLDQWHAWIGDPTVADAILDRVVHNAYKLTLKGPSGRKERQTHSES